MRVFSLRLLSSSHHLQANPNPHHLHLCPQLFSSIAPPNNNRPTKTLTPTSVIAAIRSKPSAAASIFRHAATHRGYRHTSPVYQAILQVSISRRRFSLAESLVDEVISGACPDADLPLFNDIVHFFCERKHLFSAFDVLKRMRQLKCLPSVETYTAILHAILRHYDDKSTTRYVYLRSVQSLVRQMREDGLIPDTNVMNLVIAAYSKCFHLDDALRVFDEMSRCDCRPTEFTYGYLVEGLCQNGRIEEGIRFYGEMKEKGLVPTARVYMMILNSLSMKRRFDEGIKVLYDMLGNGKTPDLLTYRTLLEGLCRVGRRSDAFELLENLKKTRRAMNQNAHSYLLKGLQWLCQDPNRI